MMKFNNASLIIAAALACSTATSGVNGLELTTKNFEEMTAGKTVFIKFFAPWSDPSKAMGPDWEKLMTEYQDHDIALVAEVDCFSHTGFKLCEKFNVKGYPTVMWGNASGAKNYRGGRDYESMSIFAKEYVTKPVCNINHVEVCSPEEKKDLESVVSMSESFKKAVGAMRKQYKELTKEHDKKLESMKVDYKYLYQVLKSRGIKDPTADDDDDNDDIYSEFYDDDFEDDDDDDDAVGDYSTAN